MITPILSVAIFEPTKSGEGAVLLDRCRALEMALERKLKRKLTGQPEVEFWLHVTETSGNWVVLYVYRTLDKNFGSDRFAHQILNLVKPLWDYLPHVSREGHFHGELRTENQIWCSYWLPTRQDQVDSAAGMKDAVRPVEKKKKKRTDGQQNPARTLT